MRGRVVAVEVYAILGPRLDGVVVPEARQCFLICGGERGGNPFDKMRLHIGSFLGSGVWARSLVLFQGCGWPGCFCYSCLIPPRWSTV